MSDNDVAIGKEKTHVSSLSQSHDSAKWHCHTTLKKFHGDSTDSRDLYETLEIEGNMLVTGGVSALLSRLMGSTAVVAFDNANAAIGVGDSTNAETDTNTDLAGTNKFRKAMDATYPQHTDTTGTVSSKTITFRATFDTTQANYVWAEWGVFNSVATTGAGLNRMLNRKVQALGTKAAGSTWQLTVQIEIN